MSFRQWLRQQQERNDPTGDLARDAMSDNRPAPRNTKTAWVGHLQSAGACWQAMRALDAAWSEYKQ